MLFERTEVTEVWCVESRIGKQLKDAGIATIQNLVQLDLAPAATPANGR